MVVTAETGLLQATVLVAVAAEATEAAVEEAATPAEAEVEVVEATEELLPIAALLL
jgi:hypothetical protein